MGDRHERLWIKVWPREVRSDPIWHLPDYVFGIYWKLVLLAAEYPHPGQVLIHNRRPNYKTLAAHINSDPARVRQAVNKLVASGALVFSSDRVITSNRMVEDEAAYQLGKKTGGLAQADP